MFRPDIVALYKSANSAYNTASPIKPAEDAGAMQHLVGLDMRFMVGCDCEWNFPDDDAQEANVGAVLPPAAADDDGAGQNAAAAAASDPHAITKWDVLDMGSILFAPIKYEAKNLAASCSAHETLILFFLSGRRSSNQWRVPDTFPEARDADLRNFPSLGPNA